MLHKTPHWMGFPDVIDHIKPASGPFVCEATCFDLLRLLKGKICAARIPQCWFATKIHQKSAFCYGTLRDSELPSTGTESSITARRKQPVSRLRRTRDGTQSRPQFPSSRQTTKPECGRSSAAPDFPDQRAHSVSRSWRCVLPCFPTSPIQSWGSFLRFGRSKE
jgi:hypothetical protein